MGEKSGNGNGACRSFGAIFNLPRQSVFDLDEEIEAQKKYQGGANRMRNLLIFFYFL